MPLAPSRPHRPLRALVVVLLTVLALGLAASTPASASAATPAAPVPPTPGDGTPAALAWLAARQDAAGASGLVRSFAIPAGDPDAGLATLSFTYDDALAALAFLAGGDPARARRVIAGLATLQEPDGSLPFSTDTSTGAVASDTQRTGTLAWAGYAMVRYQQVTGDATFQPFAERLANALLRLQVSTANGYAADDQRTGSLLGGPDVTWASTEHNIDAFFFLRDLGRLPGAASYQPFANVVQDSLFLHHWDLWTQRFYQGISTAYPDPTRALDISSWGGLFWLAIGRGDLAAEAAATLPDFRVSGVAVTRSTATDTFNATYASPPGETFAGYAPYAPGPGVEHPPQVVWPEGTWGALLLRARLGQDVSADVASLRALQQVDPAGGYVQVTAGDRPQPYEYHVWPAVAGTAWAVIVQRDPGLVFEP